MGPCESVHSSDVAIVCQMYQIVCVILKKLKWMKISLDSPHVFLRKRILEETLNEYSLGRSDSFTHDTSFVHSNTTELLSLLNFELYFIFLGFPKIVKYICCMI